MTKEEIAELSLPKVDEAMKQITGEVASLREKNGGTIVGLTGADADTVRESMQKLNDLGERRDELVGQQADEEKLTKLSELLNEPGDHPGHTKGRNGDDPQRKGGRSGDDQPGDVGALFLASPAYKAYMDHGQKDVRLKVPVESVFGSAYKGIGEVPMDAIRKTLFDSSGFPTRRDFIAQPIETLYQENNIAPLMPQGTTDSDTITYPVETVTATGAAEVSEGTTKPEAQLSFADTDEPVRTIAVLLPVTNKALRNQAFLRSYLNSRLVLFVQMREDGQILAGNGTAPNLKGILNRSGINTATSYSIGGSYPDQALIDAVFHASMRVRDSYLEPDAVVLKPSTWEIAALAKDANRNYLLGGPGSQGFVAGDPNPRLWGLRVVLNANMPAQSATNKAGLVGAFRASAMVARRGGIDLAISDSHDTFFAENKVMLRAEEEVALLVFRPAGFAAITSAA
jgi:HK97 family phage major capsid protein